jgi:hypothetical protein
MALTDKQRAYARAYYAKNRDKLKARSAAHNRKARAAGYGVKFRRANPVIALLRGAKERARLYGTEFRITLADITMPTHCPVLGLKLEHGSGKGGAISASPSLDRIDSSMGYVPGNVRVISKRANTLKNNATVAELALVLRDAKILAGLESADE